MNSLQTSSLKTLKLINVLKYNTILEEGIDFNITINQMQSYIRTKGTMQIGPLIQYTNPYTDDAGKLNIEIAFMFQCSNSIHSVELPYSMESVLRVPNCMYCRYTGPEDKINFAYDKIHLEAFEEDIPLQDCSYTGFVDSNEDTETIVADVFIPRAD